MAPSEVDSMANPSSVTRTSVPPEVRLFFRDIKENPDDDTPRLIFADWLQEHGDAAAAARGEFLRSRVLRQHLPADDPRYALLKRREGELFTAYRWAWLGPLADQARYWEFERGLVQIWAQAEKVLTAEVAAWAGSEACFWMDALTLTDVNLRHLAQLAASPLLEHLCTLDLSDNRLWELGGLFEGPAVQRLHRLVLSRNRLLAAGVAPLSASVHLRQLRVLELERNHLRDDAAEQLANAEALQSIRVLRLRHNRFSFRGVDRLRQAFGERVSL
jgi:uncharacterized protein (TIGR02996 family)